MTNTAVDFEAIKDKQRAGWETGDYPRVGNTLQIIAELLVEAADVRAGSECSTSPAARATRRWPRPAGSPRRPASTTRRTCSSRARAGRGRAPAGDLHRGRRREAAGAGHRRST